MNLQLSASRLLAAIDAALKHHSAQVEILKAQRAQILTLVNRKGTSAAWSRGAVRAAGPVAGRRAKSNEPRVKWDAVLAKLAPVFTIKDVCANKDAARKGRAQVYPAIGRWVDAGLVESTGSRGVYRKVQPAVAKTKVKKAS